jgi:hypothetical protein
MNKLCPLRNFSPCTDKCAFYNNCESSDSGIKVKFSKDTEKFACEFLDVLVLAKASNSSVQFMKAITFSNGKSLYEYLTNLGCDVEQLLSNLEKFENKAGE